MGSGNWFKLMICFGKTKENQRKQSKIYFASEASMTRKFLSISAPTLRQGSLASGKPSAVESNNHRGQGFSDVENGPSVEAKLHDLEVEWCGGPETMEEILARIHYREEASVKRERALAYALDFFFFFFILATTL
ncbi:hypothetical protein K1719_046303 [Acacia pycnantha]|nr:hypothetical protein K1719_046303 [Acacia pycnantha]